MVAGRVIAVPFHRYRRAFAGRFHVTVLLLVAYRMPPLKRASKAQKGNAKAKRRKTGHDESSGASSSNESSAVETREPIRPAVPMTLNARAERCFLLPQSA